MKKGICFLLLVAMIHMVLAAFVPVSGDEAYYWDCARHPDWSYFDQPPLMIWAVAVCNFIIEANPLMIRFPSIIASFFTGYLLLLLSRRLSGRITYGLIAYLVLQPAPAFFFGSFYLSTDAGLALFWMCALYALVNISGGNHRYWLLFGAATGLGFLAKFPIVFVFPLVLLLPRRSWKTRWLLPAALLAAVCTLPVWIWAWQNNFDNILFQLVDRHENGSPTLKYIAEFILVQWILLGPVFPTLFVVRLRAHWRGWLRDSNTRILLAGGLACFFFFSLFAITRSVGAHWAAPGYLPLALLVTVSTPVRNRRAVWGMITGGFFSLAVLVLVLAPSFFAGYAPPLPKEKLAYFFGYETLVEHLSAESSDWEFASDSFSLVTLTGFYSKGDLNPMLIRSAGGEHGLSYLYWQQKDEKIGENVIFFSNHPRIGKYAKKICETVSPLEGMNVFSNGMHRRTFYLVRGENVVDSTPFLPGE